MIDHESLGITVSLLSAFIALWAIIVSRKTADESRRITDEQKNIAHRTQILESRNLIATHNGKYSELLFSVQNEIKPYKKELAEAADRSLRELCRLFGKFGVSQHNPAKHQRQTRHVFHEICEKLHEAFNPHLSWRSGMNLSMRYNRLRDIDSDELNESEIEQLEKDAEIENIQLAKICREDINQELENIVVESYRFRFLVQQLLTRVSAENRPLIFQEALQKLSPFLTIYEQAKVSLALAQKKLEDGLAQNELEEFSLKESPSLLVAYKEEIAKLKILQGLDLTDIRCLADIQVNDSIPELIYIGSVLYTISMYWDWGHSR